MSISSLQFPAPIRRRRLVAPRDYARRDHAVVLFEAGRYQDAVRETLGYLLPGVDIPELNEQPLCFVQGSARIRLKFEGDGLVVSTALASLRTDSQATAALRYFLTRLSSTGQLFQPRLRGSAVTLEFRDQLSLLHPHKLIEVLQRMPVEADSNDAWMVDQFDIEMLDREPIGLLDDDEFARALDIWNGHWAAVDELMVESRRRRSVRFLDALGSFAANQIRYTLPLFGSVRARLNQSTTDFDDENEAPAKRDSALARCVKEMRQVSPGQLRSCLGHATHAMNPLNQGTPSILSSVLGSGDSMQTTGKLRATGRALEAALPLLADYLYLLAEHSWPSDIETALRAGLDLVSGKPWREAVDLLWNHANQTARVFGSHGEHDRDGDSEGDAEIDPADAETGDPEHSAPYSE